MLFKVHEGSILISRWFVWDCKTSVTWDYNRWTRQRWFSSSECRRFDDRSLPPACGPASMHLLACPGSGSALTIDWAYTVFVLRRRAGSSKRSSSRRTLLLSPGIGWWSFPLRFFGSKRSSFECTTGLRIFASSNARSSLCTLKFWKFQCVISKFFWPIKIFMNLPAKRNWG